MEHRNETSYLSLLTMHGTNLVKVCLINRLSNVRETVALTLGVVSVISWGIAEVPQIITNYKQKSTEGLSLAFLMTWIIGDIFNLVGCWLEPATLPTQFYMALLYTATTTVLAAQTVYYDHICKIEIDEVGQEHAFKKETQVGSDSAGRASEVNEYQGSGFIPINGEINKSISSPISVASPVGSYGSIGRELYYKSARSLSASPVPTAGSWLAHCRELCRTPSSKMPPFLTEEEASQEPLLCSVSSSSPLNIKNTLCVASSVAFFMGTYCLQFSANTASNKSTRGMVIPIARKLLQYNALDTSLIESGGSTGIGSFLGWAMAAIYMGGRLPQIWLNIRRGNVEGLSPFMFIFALLGNATYVGSILVNSMEWSSIRPNLPWLVDAGGCVLLDAFILIQFIYFKWRKNFSDVESLNSH